MQIPKGRAAVYSVVGTASFKFQYKTFQLMIRNHKLILGWGNQAASGPPSMLLKIQINKTL